MNFWSVLPQGSLQGGAAQAFIQSASQMPAANTAREHIHDHCQVHEFLAQANVGQIGGPHLVRSHHVQLLHQIRIARERMLTLRRPTFSWFLRTQQVHFAHQALDALALALRQARAIYTPALPAQLGRESARTIGRPFGRQLFQGLAQPALVSRVWLTIKGATRKLPHGADLRNRVVGR